MKGLGWIFRLHFRYPGKTLFVYIGALIELTLYTLPINFTSEIIYLVSQGNDLSVVSPFLYRILFVGLIQACLFFGISFINEILAHRITTDMTQELFESLQFRSQTYHDSKDVGNIMARATGDTRTVNIALSPAVRFVVAVFMLWVLIFIIIGRINLWLLVLSIFSFLIFNISMYRYVQKLIPLNKKVRENFAGISENANHDILGIREIKGFVSEFWVKKKMIQKANNLTQSEIKAGKKAAWMYPYLIITFYSVTMIGVSIVFAFQGLFGMDLQQIILISGYIALLLGISNDLNWAIDYIVRAKTGADRIYSIISETDEDALEDGQLHFTNQSATIEFKNVCFRYHADLPEVLHNISFRIEENQTIAIVGAPGSGKSSVAKLIQRLYHPTSGEIYLGENPINSYTNESLRKTIATVEQDIFLFNATIKENIRYGKASANDEEIIKVAKLAQAHNFIMDMPKKYDNIVGEKGVKLSGGQAQRIAIARALLVNPPILIMDDGASALDAKTEIEIQKAISEILQTHTTLITTHRLAIIAKADLIIILDKGQMVGLGTHEELIHTNQYYRRLFERHYDLPPIIHFGSK